MLRFESFGTNVLEFEDTNDDWYSRRYIRSRIDAVAHAVYIPDS